MSENMLEKVANKVLEQAFRWSSGKETKMRCHDTWPGNPTHGRIPAPHGPLPASGLLQDYKTLYHSDLKDLNYLTNYPDRQ